MEDRELLENLLHQYEQQLKQIIKSWPAIEKKETLQEKLEENIAHVLAVYRPELPLESTARIQQYRRFLDEASEILTSYYQSSYTFLSGIVGIVGGLAGTYTGELLLQGAAGVLVGFSTGFLATFFAVKQGIEHTIVMDLNN